MTKSSSRAAKPLLELKNISKSYQAGNHLFFALKNINLSVLSGSFISITGPSGAGKSTLMNLIGLLDTPTSGQIYLQGQKVSQLSQHQLAEIRNQKIGFVFQQFNLLPKTSCLENVCLPLLYSSIPQSQHLYLAQKMLTKVGLVNKFKNTPSQLSSGQQQRVAIARALINNPKIILADEPTGNLDTKTGKEIINLLHQLHSEGRTIIMITHNPQIAKQSQKVINIIDGQIKTKNV